MVESISMHDRRAVDAIAGFESQAIVDLRLDPFAFHVGALLTDHCGLRARGCRAQSWRGARRCPCPAPTARNETISCSSGNANVKSRLCSASKAFEIASSPRRASASGPRLTVRRRPWPW